ncbi:MULTISPECIES: YDG/SRA domain-containing protein [unclassified Sphingobacterium]|uniref:YDG/SRA domain-containing protein n=1 Tax=unclassified Sphingobacterium TaxID=2609468 RepID=UPI0020C3FDE1|nr:MULTISPECIES: YDG/SRA domain-containing protein [unclassified Sphingobacterium]MBV2225612.1 HNH endonuclease [Sphingobacterium mizutaii]
MLIHLFYKNPYHWLLPNELMMSNRNFGNINGVIEGDRFENRMELSIKKVHKPIQAGISGAAAEGADSIVVSGGYEDDEDLGNLIIYTGHGGRSEGSKAQVSDQTLTRGNKALAYSYENQLPVRVIRGASKHSEYAPDHGYRYDGLFYVTDYWQEKGKSGFVIWRFRLEKINNINPISLAKEHMENDLLRIDELPIIDQVSRKEYIISRIIRETKISQGVKRLYKNTCQICGIRLITAVSSYSEAAHIKGLGKPHNGPDSFENILCLCPNHHTMLDLGMITITEDFQIIGFERAKLNVHPEHKINLDFLNYHRKHHYKGDFN